MNPENDDFCMNSCDGHCCSSYSVLITSEDACRIVQNTKFKPEEFLAIYDSSVENMGFYPKFFMKGIEVERIEVVLGIKFKDNTWTCLFLSPEGLCSINHCKPRVCQTYPFNMDVKGNLIRMGNVTDVCPTKWSPHSKEVKEQIKSNLRKSWKEIDIYKQKTEAWNKQGMVGTFQEFLQFIGCK